MSERKTRQDGLGRDPDGSGSHLSDHAAPRHGRTGFDPSRLATNLLGDLANLKGAAIHTVASPTQAIVGWKVEMQDGFRGISFIQSVEGALAYLSNCASDERPAGPRPLGLGVKPASAIGKAEAPINSTMLSALKAMDEALTFQCPRGPEKPETRSLLLGHSVCEAWIQIRSAISQADRG